MNPRTRLLLAGGAMMGADLPPPGQGFVKKALTLQAAQREHDAKKQAAKPKG